MSLDPNNTSNALQAVGIAQTNNSHHHQLQPQALHQYAQQHQHQQLTQNPYYQHQVQQAHHRLTQQQQEQLTHTQLLSAVVNQQQANNQFSHLQGLSQQQVAVAAAQNSLLAAVQSFEPTAPQSEFATREQLITYIHQYARENGFGIVISHSNEKAIYFTCELGGNYRNKRNIEDKERKRKLTTRKINCPFAMVANCKKNENDEVVKWVLRITHNEHNHDKMNLTENFPMLRRRNPEINRQIRELYSKGNKPLVIEKVLKSKFKDILINREDIYNETRKMKREEKMKSQGVQGFSSSSQQSQQQVQQQVQQSEEQQQQQNDTHNLTSQDLKEEVPFDQSIPNLLSNSGIPMNLTNQYVSQLTQQANVSMSPQQQLNSLAQTQYALQATLNSASGLTSQALQETSSQNESKNSADSLSNIDISLVKQGL